MSIPGVSQDKEVIHYIHSIHCTALHLQTILC